jgi:hypothetical protein
LRVLQPVDEVNDRVNHVGEALRQARQTGARPECLPGLLAALAQGFQKRSERANLMAAMLGNTAERAPQNLGFNWMNLREQVDVAVVAVAGVGVAEKHHRVGLLGDHGLKRVAEEREALVAQQRRVIDLLRFDGVAEGQIEPELELGASKACRK